MAKIYDHTWIREEWERMGRPELEVLTNKSPLKGLWIDANNKDYLFNPRLQYRIKSKPSITWEHVHPDIVAMATDQYGDATFHKRKPKFLCFAMEWDGDPFGIANTFASFTPGTCAWQDSLVMRPVYQESE